MILVCPSCDTRYYTEASSLGKEGRRVRCASCGHSWFAKPDEDGEKAVSESTGLTRAQVERLRQTAAANAMARSGPHAEIRAREAARRRRNRIMAGALAWTMGGLMFTGAAAAAVMLRNQIADAWPRSAAVYKLVGLKVNRFGLDFEGVDAKRSFEGTTPVLTVTGWAVNATEEARIAPRIRVSLRDEDGAEVQSWTDRLPVEEIKPGDRVDFSTQIVAPPVETYSLTLTYVPDPSGRVSAASHNATVHDDEEGHEAAPAHEAPDEHATPEHAAAADEHAGNEHAAASQQAAAEASHAEEEGGHH